MLDRSPSSYPIIFRSRSRQSGVMSVCDIVIPGVLGADGETCGVNCNVYIGQADRAGVRASCGKWGRAWTFLTSGETLFVRSHGRWGDTESLNWAGSSILEF